ncbi:MAG: hypothetical protein K6G87_00060 [Butyrivibrio sp.]|uniref:hypothetical protein n=1 Tax=Butyrivibrio sp. TaxID=28121 RepID=UPI0025F396A5|nr:hypothetical protein [Butyrivibrio sp.]MCR5769602.1 hypothetical protein [Butyrivibrio sp.]
MTETNYEERYRGEGLSPESAHSLSVWIMILFWLFIPNTIASILSNERIVTSQDLLIVGNIISFIESIAYGLILLKISSKEEKYRTAGYCFLVTSAADAFKLILFAASGASEDVDFLAFGFIISLVSLVAGLIGTNSEFTGHSNVLQGVDDELSEKWLRLWKWYIGSLIAMLCSIILVYVIGMLLIICAVVVIFIVSIMKIVYIYQTSKALDEYNKRLRSEV